MTPKHESMIDYLSRCPGVEALYFQYGEKANDCLHLVTSSVETSTQTQYIDGSRLERLDYSLIWYKALGILPAVAGADSAANQNVAELDDVQGIIDWIDAQNDAHDLPRLGAGCESETIRCLSNVPQLLGIDTAYTPPLARYSLTIRVEYIDYSRCTFTTTERGN